MLNIGTVDLRVSQMYIPFLVFLMLHIAGQCRLVSCQQHDRLVQSVATERLLAFLLLGFSSMTPECRKALQSAIDELKKAISQSVGADNETSDVIKQIESTISNIESKVNWNAVSAESVAAPVTI